MADMLVRANGVELCVETFGDDTDPAILLIAGAAASMDRWDKPSAERLATGGRFVIRYDSSDTGRSICYPPGAPKYAGSDLVAEAVGVLDGDESVGGRLRDVTVPTLVMHGSEGPFLPYGHAQALAAEIPDAHLLALPGVGHQMPPRQV